MPVNLPINYEIVSRALWQAAQIATGLGPNDVAMAEDSGPVANRQKLPYCTYKITTAAIMFGEDSAYPTSPDPTVNTGFYYAGPRAVVVGFDFYGRTPLEAYGLGAALQMGLFLDAAALPLRENNIAVWNVNDVVDMSMLLGTGFEGRSHLDCTFGVTAISGEVVGVTQSVAAQGFVTDDSLVQHKIDTTPLREGSP